MNTPARLFHLAPFAAIGLCSCSIHQSTSAVRPISLVEGTRYEVRKAVSAGDTFKPHLMTSYFFVVESPHPPMLAAAAPSASPVAMVSAAAIERRPGVRTTAYTHSESDHLQYGHLTANGTFLKYGSVRSAAADWSRYPVGTRFRISGQPGVVYEVDDYGSALVGTGTIDLYKPSRSQMNEWGVRHVDIEVVRWGSWDRSLRLMQNRRGYSHVRQMYSDIQRRLSQLPSKTSTTPVTAMNEPGIVLPVGMSPST